LGLHEKILLIERLRENSAEKLRIAVLKYVWLGQISVSKGGL
jgi:hypothetical protein